jgi:alpha-L-fucosidase
MDKFTENNPERLQEFLNKLNELFDEYHPNLYTNDGVCFGIHLVIDAVREQLGHYDGL